VNKALCAAAGALVLAAAAAAQPAQTRQIEIAYDMAAGVFTGEATYAFTITGARYEASANRRLTGLARMATGSSQDYRYRVTGQVTADGQVRPANYEHQGGRRNRLVRTAFSPTDAVTTAEPAMGMGDPPATAAQKAGAVDQVSMFLAMMLKRGELCAGTLRVLMDGRGRADFVMSPNGTQQVSQAGFRGDAVRCRVRFQPIAGFGDPQQPSDLTFLFAPIGGVSAPLVIEVPTEEGQIVRLTAQRFTVR
jgi:hypothetical protein